MRGGAGGVVTWRKGQLCRCRQGGGERFGRGKRLPEAIGRFLAGNLCRARSTPGSGGRLRGADRSRANGGRFVRRGSKPVRGGRFVRRGQKPGLVWGGQKAGVGRAD